MKVPTALLVDAFLDANGTGDIPVSSLNLGTFENALKISVHDMIVDYSPEALKAAAKKFPKVFVYDPLTMELSRPSDYVTETPIADFFKNEKFDEPDDYTNFYRLYDSSVVKWYNHLRNDKDFAMMKETGREGINFSAISMKQLFDTVHTLRVLGSGSDFDDFQLKDLYELFLRNVNAFTLNLESVGAVVSGVCDVDEDNNGNDTLKLPDVFYGKYVDYCGDGTTRQFYDSQGMDVSDELVSIIISAMLMLSKIAAKRKSGYEYIRIQREGEVKRVEG